MNLQQLTIEKIDAFGGRRKLIGELEKYSLFLRGRQRSELMNIIIYIDMLYAGKVNVIFDAIHKRTAARRFLGSLETLIALYNANGLKLVKELITFNLEMVENLEHLS